MSCDWRNVHGLILFLGIKGVFDDYKQQKRKKMTQASASVCLLLATAPDWVSLLGVPKCS